MDNQSTISDFLLFEFSEIPEVQMLYFFVFMVLYLAIVTVNILIISAIAFDHCLHTPMYLFLINLAIQDLGRVSIIFPKSMTNMHRNTRHISFFGCAFQVFFVIESDVGILTVMAYDRYVAICNPLKYETKMNKQFSLHMLLAVWVTGFLSELLHTYFTFAILFCSNIVNQFFCEIPQLLKLTCADFNKNKIRVLAFSSVLGFGCFSFIFITYVFIFSAVLKIPSTRGKKKAFSTCLPHLIVVSMFILSGAFAYLRPPSTKLDLASTVMYSLIPPLLNPIIYSMRNKNIKLSLSKLLNMDNYSDNHTCFFICQHPPCNWSAKASE